MALTTIIGLSRLRMELSGLQGEVVNTASVREIGTEGMNSAAWEKLA